MRVQHKPDGPRALGCVCVAGYLAIRCTTQLSEQIRKANNVDPLVQALAALVLGMVYQFLTDTETAIKRCDGNARWRLPCQPACISRIAGNHKRCVRDVHRKELREIIVNLIGLDSFLPRLQHLREASALKNETDLTAVRRGDPRGNGGKAYCRRPLTRRGRLAPPCDSNPRCTSAPTANSCCWWTRTKHRSCSRRLVRQLHVPARSRVRWNGRDAIADTAAVRGCDGTPPGAHRRCGEGGDGRPERAGVACGWKWERGVGGVGKDGGVVQGADPPARPADSVAAAKPGRRHGKPSLCTEAAPSRCLLTHACACAAPFSLPPPPPPPALRDGTVTLASPAASVAACASRVTAAFVAAG